MKPTARDGQFMMVLLTALVDLDDRIPTKREVWKYIETKRWLQLPPDLLERSYEVKEVEGEPKWVTILCFARQNAIERGWMERLKVRDAWEISETGRELVSKREQLYREGRITPSRYEFLSEHYHQRMREGRTENHKK